MKRRPFEIAAGTAVILAALPPLRAAQEPTTDSIKQDAEVFRSGKFAEAEKDQAAALAKDASNSQTVLRLGEIALLGNRFEKAERNLKGALKLRPDDKRPKLLLAETYYRQDRLTQTAPLFREAGREVTAAMLASFKGLIPYEISGQSDITHLKFVQTGPLPVIRVRFRNGVERLLVIDTGASELYLDTRLVEKLGPPQFGSTTGKFAGGKSAPVENARLNSIQFGDFQIKNLPVIVKDLRTPISVPGEAAPVGIIGTVVFYHFFATLGYPSRLELRCECRDASIDAGSQR